MAACKCWFCKTDAEDIHPSAAQFQTPTTSSHLSGGGAPKGWRSDSGPNPISICQLWLISSLFHYKERWQTATDSLHFLWHLETEMIKKKRIIRTTAHLFSAGESYVRKNSCWLFWAWECTVNAKRGNNYCHLNFISVICWEHVILQLTALWCRLFFSYETLNSTVKIKPLIQFPCHNISYLSDYGGTKFFNHFSDLSKCNPFTLAELIHTPTRAILLDGNQTAV